MNAIVGRFTSASPEQQFFFLLTLLGIIHFVRSISQIFRALWILLLRPSKDLSSYGDWALVTGASDGIGRAFCSQLAAKKINLVVVSRTESKLQDLVKELQQKYEISAKFVVVDFAGDKLDAELEGLASAIQDLEIGILINNVGVSYPYARFFHEVDEELLKNLVQVNIMATTRVSQLIVPGMLKRRKGAIINIGSGSGSILPADPLYSIYAASKGYIEVLSRSMYVEYKQLGIDVQCQAPLLVKTKLAKIRQASLTVPSPDSYAASALRSIGYEPLSTPYWTHHLLWTLISVLPPRIVNAVRLKSNLDLRKRGLAKDAKVAKTN